MFDSNYHDCPRFGSYECGCDEATPRVISTGCRNAVGDGHMSSCSTHNMPAYPNGPCDCGGVPCRVCGCTVERPCDGICTIIAPGLCSNCEEK